MPSLLMYHLAEAANWPRIQREGLLPANALIARSGLRAAERAVFERHQRLAHVTLSNDAQRGRVLPAAPLRPCQSTSSGLRAATGSDRLMQLGTADFRAALRRRGLEMVKDQ